MKGQVDLYGRALVSVTIQASDLSTGHEIEVWIDTGFTGDLVLPMKRIQELGLPQAGTVKGILADGSEIALQRFACLVDWFGERRELEVVANDGDYPLLGVGLLVERELNISYRTGVISID
jgi:clan AA aspartic protease